MILTKVRGITSDSPYQLVSHLCPFGCALLIQLEYWQTLQPLIATNPVCHLSPGRGPRPPCPLPAHFMPQAVSCLSQPQADCHPPSLSLILQYSNTWGKICWSENTFLLRLLSACSSKPWMSPPVYRKIFACTAPQLS